MDDVRAQLIATVSRYAPAWDDDALDGLAVVILERFEVTPKPVMTHQELGRLVEESYRGQLFLSRVGERLEEKLASAGLQIVRVDS